jgi:hypothetical protein
MAKFVCLPLHGAGWIWVNPDEVRLIRISGNDPEVAANHVVQLKDGLEYDITGRPAASLEALK